MIARLKHLVSLAAAFALISVSNPAAADSGWAGELGFLGGSHDNFFFRGGDNPAPASDLLTGYLTVEKSRDVGQGEFTLGLDATAVSVTDIDSADYQTFELTTEYKRGPWKASLGYGRLLNRLYSESGEAVFFDETVIEFWLRYSINRRVWVRLQAGAEDLDFGTTQDGRDADGDEFSLTLRVAATEHLGVRLAWLSADRTAKEPENNRSGSGLGVALEGAPNEDLTWFLRYRSRDRDYEDAPIDDSNFDRSDTVEDVTFNVRWRFSETLGLMVRDSYRSGDSTRLDRNFTGNLIEAGVFFQFGSRP